ncbi:hypothetical protein QBC34DRAFT_387639 [Podospora aff. communis PSN243]|uniref:SWI5-dependent HO expression protein 3 n=1 Tax=Podospora aff. communis PSN243 TaxID=3040156 RepID=A0AAV9FYJ6_9PEZI|nr:hypothetical protein QBC34DRAFT_387639 [Podospora aff. communis PSN243]
MEDINHQLQRLTATLSRLEMAAQAAADDPTRAQMSTAIALLEGGGRTLQQVADNWNRVTGEADKMKTELEGRLEDLRAKESGLESAVAARVQDQVMRLEAGFVKRLAEHEDAYKKRARELADVYKDQRKELYDLLEKRYNEDSAEFRYRLEWTKQTFADSLDEIRSAYAGRADELEASFEERLTAHKDKTRGIEAACERFGEAQGSLLNRKYNSLHNDLKSHMTRLDKAVQDVTRIGESYCGHLEEQFAELRRQFVDHNDRIMGHCKQSAKALENRLKEELAKATREREDLSKQTASRSAEKTAEKEAASAAPSPEFLTVTPEAVKAGLNTVMEANKELASELSKLLQNQQDGMSEAIRGGIDSASKTVADAVGKLRAEEAEAWGRFESALDEQQTSCDRMLKESHATMATMINTLAAKVEGVRLSMPLRPFTPWDPDAEDESNEKRSAAGPTSSMRSPDPKRLRSGPADDSEGSENLKDTEDLVML